MTEPLPLPMWVIFHNPTDFPGKYVVRQFDVTSVGPKPSAEASVHDSLEEARASVPEGLFRMPRDQQDEPQILETWL